MTNSKNCYTQSEIVAAWEQANQAVFQPLSDVEPPLFFATPNEKWSIAQNLQHLIISTKPIIKALGMPKLALRAFGRPQAPSRTYDEMVQIYQGRLAEGPVNAGRYAPTANSVTDKKEVLEIWQSIGKKLSERINKWQEADFDQYCLVHPLLGKLTVREMLFFTIYHTGHHLKAMQKIMSATV